MHNTVNPVSGNGSGGNLTNMDAIQVLWNGKYQLNDYIRTTNVGGNGYHGNIQPSKAVYRFRRTA